MVKRIIALALCIASMVSIFSGCAKVAEGSTYATKGEFFAMFIADKGLYSDRYSNEQIAENETYELEAEVMYEWMLIDENQMDNLSDGVTKSMVAQVCLRFMSFREECVAKAGQTPVIKDLAKCQDRQAVSDAVALGIFELENGYFDALKKMTYDECIAAMEKADSVSSNFRADDGLDVEYHEDVYEITDTDILGVKFYEDAYEADELSADAGDGRLTMLSANSNVEISTLGSSNNNYIELMIPTFTYDREPQRYHIGSMVMYDPSNPMLKDRFLSKDGFYRAFAGKIVEVEKGGAMVTLTIKGCEMEKLVKDTDGINKAATMDSKPLPEDYIDHDRKDGFTIKRTESETGVVLGFKHTFTLTDEIYSNQKWRNAEAKPVVTLDITLDKFSVTTKNLGKLLLGLKADAQVRVDFETKIEATVHAGGMRFSPANNGNGGALANIANSRWTGANAGGSEAIKLGKADIPLGTSGFTITCYLFLVIQLDGSARVVATMDNSYLLSAKKGRWGSVKVTITDETEKPRLEQVDVHANIYAGLLAKPGIYFWGQCIADAAIHAGVNLLARASVYKKGEKKPQLKNVYACQEDLDEEYEYSYCIHTELNFVARGNLLTRKSLIGKVISKTFGVTIPTFELHLPLGSCHFEDGREMSSCSKTGEGAVEVSSDAEINLETYKVTLLKNEEKSVAITAVPVNDKKIENVGGITVTSGNKSVVKAYYNEATKIIDLVAMGEGSTEITIKIKKKKGKKDYYVQTISVTVSANPATQAADDGVPQIDSSMVVIPLELLNMPPKKCKWC